jgi:EAL domain-containing protein (putative c-di-GMP-specific phosphodiesterase class I)
MIDELLDQDLLYVTFQPIYDLQRGCVFAHEVLGRVRPHDGPVLGPEALLDEAHACGRLLELERAWRSRALQAIAALDPRGEHRFFLNVDTRIVDDPRVPGSTRREMRQLGLNPRNIVFELTERNPSLGARRLAELLPHYKEQGFGIALDDLGSGHASLRVMLCLRPDTVKLDRELVAGVATDPMRRHLVHALSIFTFRAGIVLVAEGVEEHDDYAMLCELGVRYAQGYYFARPAAALADRSDGPFDRTWRAPLFAESGATQAVTFAPTDASSLHDWPPLAS